MAWLLLQRIRGSVPGRNLPVRPERVKQNIKIL